jgi:hypothetical protein
MKILGATDKIPRPRTGKKRSKYSPLCEKVMALEHGKWLSVECENDNEVRSLAVCMKNKKFKAIHRGLKLFVSS